MALCRRRLGFISCYLACCISWTRGAGGHFTNFWNPIWVPIELLVAPSSIDPVPESSLWKRDPASSINALAICLQSETTEWNQCEFAIKFDRQPSDRHLTAQLRKNRFWSNRTPDMCGLKSGAVLKKSTNWIKRAGVIDNIYLESQMGVEHRCVVGYLHRKGTKLPTVVAELMEVYHEDAFDENRVNYWLHETKLHHSDLSDRPRPGWPPLEDVDARILQVLEAEPWSLV
jgi:hypothetical protein